MLELASRGQVLKSPVDSIRDPYVLDFLSLPDDRVLHEPVRSASRSSWRATV
jgi:hypothetical protein